MAHRSQRSSLEDNPLDPNYLPPHYREEYRLAIDALVEHDLEGYYSFLQRAGVVDFLSQPEMDYIRSTVQVPRQISQPELPYFQSEADGSSDTYWPVHSDLEAPCLDLGWPMQHGFIGPTEVTTLVNPSDPEMPSIKEQARRLIRSAQQVIAVAMDMFTDVDIFSDLLDAVARHVGVYILLDEQNAHHFSNMVTNCRVNLEMLQLMRVRTVSGTTYFCRTGKSFKGQMMNRFLLVDCKAVLSGNYSFMWMFEKIHRCIAHLFLGELVITFDEEFRILYAQSEPLVIENALVPVPEKSTYGVRQFLNPRAVPFKSSREHLHIESPHFPEQLGYPMEDRMDLERNMPFLRRSDPFCGFTDPEALQVYGNKYSSQQLKMEQSFLGQDRSIMASRQMEMHTYKRHSHAEGNQESYASSRQIMKHHIRYHPEDVESLSSYHREQHYHHGGGPGSGHGMYNRVQTHGYPHADQYSEQYGYQPELELPGSYNRGLDYLSSESSREIGQGFELKPNLVEGCSGQSSTRRPSLGQPYPCQSSPTPSYPGGHKQLFIKSSQDHQPRDPSVKHGLRKWRINSYLSALENPTDEGLPEPLGPEAFDEPPHQSEEELYGPEVALSKFRDQSQIPTIKQDFLPHYGKPVVPKLSENQPCLGADSQKTLETAEAVQDSGLASVTGRDKAGEVELRKPREIFKQESFRSRPNLSLLKSSRLRSSLIFSSSPLEQHISTEMKSAEELKHSENPAEEKENDPLRTSSVIAEILEKRRFMPREPIDWSIHKQKPIQNAPSTTETNTEDGTNVSLEKTNLYKASSESSLKIVEVPDSTNIPENKEIPKDPGQNDQSKSAAQDKPKIIITEEIPKPLFGSTSFLNMNDPETRFLYFKELAAKRKALKIETKCDTKVPEPPATHKALSKGLAESSSKTKVESETLSVSKEDRIPIDSANEQKKEQLEVALEEPTKMTVESHKASESTAAFINMNDPETRFLYFKELAAKRKASQIETKRDTKIPEPPATHKDLSEDLIESSSKTNAESETSAVLKEHEIPTESANEHEKEQHKVALEAIKMTEESHKGAAEQIASKITVELIQKPHLTTDLSETAAENTELSVGISKSAVIISEVSQSQPESIIEKACVSVELVSSEPVVPLLPEPSVPDHLEQTLKSSSQKALDYIAKVFEKDPVLKLVDQEPTPDISNEQDALRPSLPTSAAVSVLSCDEELLRDATDAEKTELMKSCHHGTPNISLGESSKALYKGQLSGLSPSTLDFTGEQHTKVPDHLHSHVQKVKGKEDDGHTVAEDMVPQTMTTGNKGSNQVVKDEHNSCLESNSDIIGMEDGKGQDINQNPHTLTASKNTQSRYQTSITNVLYSSNLRDDTKVILERISANSQNRMDLAKQSAPITDDAKEGGNEKSTAKAPESVAAGQTRSQFGQPRVNPEDREVLLKRIESMRKEKKVYSRFEMGS